MTNFYFPKQSFNPYVQGALQPGEVSAGTLFLSSLEAEGVRSSLGGASRRFAEQFRAEHYEDSPVLSAEEATKRYGVEGHLSFSRPVKENVAKILRQRKDRELEYDRIMGTAEGFLQNSAVFSGAMVSSLLDPATLAVSAIPVLGPARWASLIKKYGVVRGRMIGGAIEGGVGNLAIEPFIIGQAAWDQSEYSAWDSLMNVGMGTLLGGGFGLLAGRWNKYAASVRQKAHLNAIKAAVNQLGEGKKVQVEPIVQASAKAENLGVSVDLDEGVNMAEIEALASPEITNMKPPHFVNEQFDPDPDSGWFQQFVPSQDLDIGNWVTYSSPNQLKVAGQVVDADENFVHIEVSHSADPQFTPGEVYGLIKGDDTEVQVHVPINEEVTLETVKVPESEMEPDDSPMLGDTDTQTIELINGFRHQEAINEANLELVKMDKIGSHIGTFSRDVTTGKQYYVKYPKDTDQTLQEYIASVFYKMAGVSIPEVRPVYQDGKLVAVASEDLNEKFDFNDITIPDNEESLLFHLKKVKDEDPAAFEEFISGVMVDAWLGNRDFSAPGNIVIVRDPGYYAGIESASKKAQIFRIDFGGSLEYRAQGELKDDFRDWVDELLSFKSSKYMTGKILSIMDDGDKTFKRGVARVANISDNDILAVVYSTGLQKEKAVELAGKLIARRDNILSRNKYDVKKTNHEVVELFHGGQFEKFFSRQIKAYAKLPNKITSFMKAYKGTFYDSVNDFLRFGKASSHDLTKIKAAVKAMDQATKAHVFQSTTVLWRGGVPWQAFGFEGPETFEELVQELILGGQQKIFHDKAFMSTTVDRHLAMNWGGPNRLVLKLEVPPGYTSAIPGVQYLEHKKAYSWMDSENEFILPRNTKFVPVTAYVDHSTRIVVVAKVVPHENIAPITPKQAIQIAKDHKTATSIGADDEGIPEELVYSLRDSLDVKEDESLITTINKESDELQAVLKENPEIGEDGLKSINDEFSEMEKQVKAMTKGATAAYGCVMRNAQS